MKSNYIYRKFKYLFFSPEYYQNNVSQKILFKWLILLSLLQSVFLLSVIYDSKNKILTSIKNIPDIVIEKGVIVSDLHKPYLIKTTKNSSIIINFDKKNELSNASVGSMLITRENIEIKSANKISKYPISELCLKLFKTDNLIINEKFLLNYYDQIKVKLFILSILIFIPISILMFSVSNLLQFALTGIIIWVISKISSKKIDLVNIVNLSILAAIPAIIIIELVVSRFNIFLSPNALSQIAAIINFAYLYFAFKSSLKEK